METLTRRSLSAGLIASTLPLSDHPAARAAGERIPSYGAFWRRLPLPRTPAEAFASLTPATQAEIGAAVIGMYLAQYIAGDGMAEADQFLDGDLRDAACTVEHDILNRMDDRLWSLFPDLYGPDGDHPRWALEGGLAR